MSIAKPTEEIRIVSCLSELGDEAALYNAFTGGAGRFRLCARASSLYEVTKVMHDQQAHVLIIDQGMLRGDKARQHLAVILTQLLDNPAFPIVAIGIFQDRDWQIAFEKHGAYGVIQGPLNQLAIEELRELVGAVVLRASTERQGRDYVENRLTPDLVRALQGKGVHHHTICVWAPKGGVGKSTIAVNVAYALGVLAEEPTLLVDGDMNAADSAGYLGVNPETHNIATLATDWAANNKRLDKAMARKHIVRVGKRLDSLCGAYDMTLTGREGLRSEEFAQALYSTVSSLDYSFVVFDLGQSYFEPLHFVPLVRCSRVLAIATNEASTVRELGPALDGLRTVVPGEVTPEKWRLVLNKWTERTNLERRDIQNATKLQEAGCIPYGDYAAITNRLNKGLPLVTENNEVGNALLSLASAFHPALQQLLDRRLNRTVKGPGLLSRLKPAAKAVASV